MTQINPLALPTDPTGLHALQTETHDGRYAQLDTLTIPALLQAFAADQTQAAASVLAALPQMETVLEAMLPRIHAGGRLVYVGAGTSGRLGLLDSAELYPTFSWSPERAIALLAGGQGALVRAVENAEDNAEAGAGAIRDLQLNAQDCVLALAASGRTPYCIGAVQAAKAVGALCVAVVNNAGSPLAAVADLRIELLTGAEVIAGSTRLKAGTAQKIALNTLSSSLMVRLGKVYGNRMVDVRASNAKLRIRACRLVVESTGVEEAEAQAMLERCGYQVKTALVALLTGNTPEEAKCLLDQAGGRVREALSASHAPPVCPLTP